MLNLDLLRVNDKSRVSLKGVNGYGDVVRTQRYVAHEEAVLDKICNH